MSEKLLEGEVVTLQADKPFEVEFNGPSDAQAALILVHGFGVRRDSRGLFPAIEQNVAVNMLSVRGDFSSVDADHTETVPFSIQVARLHEIVKYSRERFQPQRLTFVGHSQGALVVALAHPTNSKILLLAPPIDSPFESFIATPGWTRPGSVLDVDGESILARSDGSITKVSPAFWEEFKDVDARRLYQQLADDNEVAIVLAGADQVLGEQEAPQGLHNDTVPDADHDFSGPARKVLLNMIQQHI